MEPEGDGYPTVFILKNAEVISVGYGRAQTEYTNEASGRLILDIINSEGDEISYRIAIKIDGEPSYIFFNGESVEYIESITLADGEEWRQEIGFTPLKTGDNQKVEFILYKDNEAEPYRSLHIWVNVVTQD
jgi:uncharacterized membrane protein